jgi:hypothetical protein
MRELAQPAHAVDRFAREIVCILTGFISALAAAERQPVRPPIAIR